MSEHRPPGPAAASHQADPAPDVALDQPGRAQADPVESERAQAATAAGGHGDGTAGDQAADDTARVVAELEDRWRRAVADLDNFRKRYARELTRERVGERNRTAAAFLPVLDNLELALTHAGSDPAAIVEGVRRVADQARSVLEGLGYPRHDEVRVPFDPARHEVVAAVDDPAAEPGTVVEVVQPGYGDGPTQLRPAAVAVARRPG